MNTTPAEPAQHETRSVPVDKAQLVRVDLKMGSGELDVSGGAQTLLDADFTYTLAAWKPDLSYVGGGETGDLTIRQPSSTSSGHNATNRWDLRFNDHVPLNMKVEFGAGEAKLNLGSLSLGGLDVQIGAGTLNLDLRGTPPVSYTVRVQGGVGDATIYLPKDVGITARATGGLGSVSATGLQKDGDQYVNDSHDTAKVKIRLDIEGGVGSIKLIAG